MVRSPNAPQPTLEWGRFTALVENQMVDLATITAGLAALEGAVRGINSILDADAVLKKLELKLHLAEVKVGLADAKLALIDAQGTIAQLEQFEDEIERLKAFREREFRHESGTYIEVDEHGVAFDGPFCPRAILM